MSSNLSCENCGEKEASVYGVVFGSIGQFVHLCEDCWVIKYDYGKRYDERTVVLPQIEDR